ncbi:MAG: hypothetical protein H5T75_05700 [Coriobacteriia bacterium]|nr:hypothetical protein [Coriobacteriia bacterium]
MGLPLFLGFVVFSLKRLDHDADICRIMIISDEQARRAAEYLRVRSDERECDTPAAHLDESVVARAVRAALSAPEIRIDRVRQATYVAEGYLPDSETVAAKLIGRIISDSIR